MGYHHRASVLAEKLCRTAVLLLVLLLAGTAFAVINSVTPPGYVLFLLAGRLGALGGVVWRNRVVLAYVAIVLFLAHEVWTAAAYLVIASPRFHDFFTDLDTSVVRPVRQLWRRQRFCLRVRLKCRRWWRWLVERLMPTTVSNSAGITRPTAGDRQGRPRQVGLAGTGDPRRPTTG